MSIFKKNIIKAMYKISCLFPRNKKVWAFIGWHKKADGEVFADNAKYFFLFVSQDHPEIKSVWIAKSRELAVKLKNLGYTSYYEKSLMGIYYQLTAGVFVIDAYLQPNNYMLSGALKIVQLLHGKGMKKKGYADKPDKVQNFIFNTSPFTLSILPEVFKNGSRSHITGYSRNDIFFREIKDSDIDIDTRLIGHLQNIRSNKKIVMYAPTFRRGQKELDINKIIPLEKLSKYAEEQNVFFILSLHNKYRSQQSDGNIKEYFAFIKESDIYPLLPLVDIFITDYSSSFADYLLLDRPLIFYPYDLEEYNEKEGLVADYNEITPGPKVMVVDELFDAITSCISTDTYTADRKRVRDLYHTYQDGDSSKRIWETISGFLK